jgi:four helix bundle protein
MRVFELAVRVTVMVYRATETAPPRARTLVEQLIKSSSSIALNIAEGVEEFRPLEKARFYTMARRSAGESAATLSILRGIGAVQVRVADECAAVLPEIAAMLTAMAKTQEARAVHEDGVCELSGRGGRRRGRNSGARLKSSRCGVPDAAVPSPSP